VNSGHAEDGRHPAHSARDLSGKVADANAVYLCRELRRLGVDVRRLVFIPDEIEPIAHEVAAQSRAYDYVFTSAGRARTTTSRSTGRPAMAAVVREPRLVDLFRGFYRESLNEARLRWPTSRGAELVTADALSSRPS